MFSYQELLVNIDLCCIDDSFCRSPATNPSSLGLFCSESNPSCVLFAESFLYDDDLVNNIRFQSRAKAADSHPRVEDISCGSLCYLPTTYSQNITKLVVYSDLIADESNLICTISDRCFLIRKLVCQRNRSQEQRFEY